jgi:hypothetical protein
LDPGNNAVVLLNRDAARALQMLLAKRRQSAHPDLEEATMKRFAIILIATTALVTATAGSGSAAPPNKTSLTLSCDRGTTGATVVVTLRASISSLESTSPLTLSCGSSDSGGKSERLVAATAFPATYAVIAQFSISTSVESVGCAAEGTLPIKFSCTDSAGLGATVVIH